MLAFINSVQFHDATTLQILSFVCFIMAIFHSLISDQFLVLAHRSDHTEDGDTSKAEESFTASIYYFLGNMSCIFGIWLIPVLLYMIYDQGVEYVHAFLDSQDTKEPIFQFIVIAIALSRPLRHLFANCLRVVSFFFKNHLMYWWLCSFLFSILLTGVLSEIAVMTLQCSLLTHFFYTLRPSQSLSYFTISLLLVCIAFGNTIFPFNLTYIFPIHEAWGWDQWSIYQFFGWKAFISLSVVIIAGAFYFRKEFADLQEPFDEMMEEVSHHPINFRFLLYLGLLCAASLCYNSPYLLFGLLMIVIFLHKKKYRTQEEGELHLRLPLFVAFFTFTLNIFANLQSWWVIPLMQGSEDITLFFNTFFLSATNENVPIFAVKTAMTHVPNISDFLIYMAIIAGSGLCFFSNSTNILAKKKLDEHFEYYTISPVKQTMLSIPIALFVCVLIVLLNHV